MCVCVDSITQFDHILLCAVPPHTVVNMLLQAISVFSEAVNQHSAQTESETHDLKEFCSFCAAA